LPAHAAEQIEDLVLRPDGGELGRTHRHHRRRGLGQPPPRDHGDRCDDRYQGDDEPRSARPQALEQCGPGHRGVRGNRPSLEPLADSRRDDQDRDRSEKLSGRAEKSELAQRLDVRKRE